MRSMRRCVRPQAHGPSKIFDRSRVRYLQQRRRLALERGENQLSLFAVFARLQGVGIDHLDNVRVFPNVHAALVHALESHAGPVHLAEAVGIVCIDLEQPLDLFPRVLRIRLGAEEGLF